MGSYPALIKGGQNSIVAQLKKAWPAYHKNALQVKANFGKGTKTDKDRSGITTWHYRTFLRIDSEVCDNAHWRYFTSRSKQCGCYDGLKVWWEACELAALVVPLSGTVEHVFSLANSLFSEK